MMCRIWATAALDTHADGDVMSCSEGVRSVGFHATPLELVCLCAVHATCNYILLRDCSLMCMQENGRCQEDSFVGGIDG